jgi:hypothetical protein
VTEPFNWPPKESEVEAVELGTDPIAAPDPARTGPDKEDFTQERRTSRFSSGPDLAALDAIQQRLRAKAMRSEEQLDAIDRPASTTQPDGISSGASGAQGNRHAVGSLAPSMESEPHRHDANRADAPPARRWHLPIGRFKPFAAKGAIAEALRSDWRPAAYRWALLALAVVVVVESALLAIGYRNSRMQPAAGVQANAVTPAAERPSTPAPPAEAVDWQAAVAANAAVVGPPADEPKPSPVAASPVPVAAPGSLSIALPFQVEVYEDDRFVGVNNGAAIRLSAGSHRLTLVNESLRYRATQTVNISSGRTTTVTASLPTGMLQLNATPWAEVLLDGKSLGETPLGNVSVPIGPHTLVFRHPELGQQSRSVVVTAQSSTRVVVDLQK